MNDSIQPTPTWHIHAIQLPDGDQPVHWWVHAGRISTTPIAGAHDLPGGWFLPGGLVDAHVHLSMNTNGFDLPDGSAELVQANLQSHYQAGVLAVRDAGLAWGGQPDQAARASGRLQSAGNLYAPAGRGYPQICLSVAAEHLIDTALAEARQGTQWIKIIGDFPGPDGNWFAAPANYPPELLRELVTAVHAAGARLMAHTTGTAIADLVEAGFDSIEHGMQMTEQLVQAMAEHGIAWSLTLATAMKHVGPLAALDDPVGQYIRMELDRARRFLPLAVAQGVPILAGTDELPAGALVQELSMLEQYGLSRQAILHAASVGARQFLGLPSIQPGSQADLVTYSSDPRLDLAALAQPTAVLLGGQRIV